MLPSVSRVCERDRFSFLKWEDTEAGAGAGAAATALGASAEALLAGSVTMIRGTDTEVVLGLSEIAAPLLLASSFETSPSTQGPLLLLSLSLSSSSYFRVRVLNDRSVPTFMVDGVRVLVTASACV